MKNQKEIIVDFSSQIKAMKRSDLPDSAFLFPKERSFPITSPQSVKNAISDFGRSNLTMSYEEFIHILYKKCKELGQSYVDAIPEETRKKFGLE